MRQFLMMLAFSSAASAIPAPMGNAWTLNTIPWQARAPNGTRFALLEGDRSNAAPFTYAFSIPAGVWDGPHWHSQTARVFVARGALRIGYGDHPDRASARRYPVGSIVVVPGGAHHYDGADVDTVIIRIASGPWSTRYVDGGAPASAGTPIRQD